ncbi:MAG: RnfABCDGE type electron transport complex subunit B [Clostridiales bacterium]|nr:RnfABCDGE type electron transport complex subunit B [Clostridiales bacterium]
MQFVTPVILVAIIGLIAGVILTVAAKFMAVETDETAALILEILPGANCGACGFAGCEDYANALAADRENTKANLCTPGGNQVVKDISEILGLEVEEVASKIAIMKCSGTLDRTSYSMDYQGYPTCQASKLFYRGRGKCEMACLGFGDCVAVCDYDAIKIENAIAVIDREKCIGCGLCAKACPNNLIEIVPAKTRVVVGCSSIDKAKDTRQICNIGCIACNRCVKECKFDAIHVIDNHAVIDYEKCTNCTLCSKVCPTKVIHVYPRIKKN